MLSQTCSKSSFSRCLLSGWKGRIVSGTAWRRVVQSGSTYSGALAGVRQDVDVEKCPVSSADPVEDLAARVELETSVTQPNAQILQS